MGYIDPCCPAVTLSRKLLPRLSPTLRPYYMSADTSSTPFYAQSYYTFSAPTHIELLALLIVNNIENLPSDPTTTTYAHFRNLDGSSNPPFIRLVENYPSTSVTTQPDEPSDSEPVLRYPSPSPEPSSSISSHSSIAVSPSTSTTFSKCRTDPSLRCTCKKCHL